MNAAGDIPLTAVLPFTNVPQGHRQWLSHRPGSSQPPAWSSHVLLDRLLSLLAPWFLIQAHAVTFAHQNHFWHGRQKEEFAERSTLRGPSAILIAITMSEFGSYFKHNLPMVLLFSWSWIFSHFLLVADHLSPPWPSPYCIGSLTLGRGVASTLSSVEDVLCNHLGFFGQFPIFSSLERFVSQSQSFEGLLHLEDVSFLKLKPGDYINYFLDVLENILIGCLHCHYKSFSLSNLPS